MYSRIKVEEEKKLDQETLEQLLGEREEDFRKRSLSPNTRRGYENDWKDFTAWCAEHGAESLPATAATLKRYFADRSSTLAKASLTRRIAAISRYHQWAEQQSPTTDPGFRAIMAGIRRTKTDTPAAKEALLAEDLIEILGQIPDHTPQGQRDRALLLLGFTAALRRSELVALDRADVRITGQGIVLTIRQSKTDQEGAGVEVGVPRGRKPETCPVKQLEAWLVTAKITDGPIFRQIRKGGEVLPGRLSDRAVALIVKRYVGHAGFSSENYSGHSLRAGLATSAALAGSNERQIMQQTRHKSERMVRVYIRKGSLFNDNVVEGLGF
jgi:site-specific recombinase XerD